jgi:hypothetical protein
VAVISLVFRHVHLLLSTSLSGRTSVGSPIDHLSRLVLPN